MQDPESSVVVTQPADAAPATTRAEVKEQVQVVMETPSYFTPKNGLPVLIRAGDWNNPYELSEDVTYKTPSTILEMKKGFRWDGASIPTWLPIVPWVISLVLMQFFDSAWVWAVTAFLIAYTIRILPYLQKMGPHSRGDAVHDGFYETQPEPRVVCDAIRLAIHIRDKVPVDVRTLQYAFVRMFGWIAWRRHRLANEAAAAAAAGAAVTSDKTFLQRHAIALVLLTVLVTVMLGLVAVW